MILQNENGMFRLSQELANLDSRKLDEWVRISPPPPAGLSFDRPEFRSTLAREIAKFRPDLVLLDPWNAVARDEKARDYRETFDAIREVIPAGDESPALGIVAHTRKPKTDERPTGRAFLHEIAGSYVIGSVARCAFIMQNASDDPAESRIVWSCCKNNDGQPGARSAWERRNGLFERVADFDWGGFDSQGKPNGPGISLDDVRAVFEGGKELTRSQARDALIALTGGSRSSCYAALNQHGNHLEEVDGKLIWKQ
jgi:hypothetical protein